jgi:hypothetical protein
LAAGEQVSRAIEQVARQFCAAQPGEGALAPLFGLGQALFFERPQLRECRLVLRILADWRDRKASLKLS